MYVQFAMFCVVEMHTYTRGMGFGMDVGIDTPIRSWVRVGVW